MTTRVTLTTANTPGAVAIIQLHGGGVVDVLKQLTGREHWPARRALLCGFAGIDEGLAIWMGDDLHPSPDGRGAGGEGRSEIESESNDDVPSGDPSPQPSPMGRGAQTAQLMPHGGPRVVQRLIEHLTGELGCAYEPEPDPQALYPEAASPIEAEMLDAIAQATSPAAIDLLTAQPNLWRGLLQQAGEPSESTRQTITTRTQTLNRLLTPPTIVVAGSANVGKSTLTNTLMGKRVSIVADLPGTTRDWVGGLVELSATNGTSQAIATYWLDTPGLRVSDDVIEQRAIALARQQIEQADVLIAMRDPGQPWPEPGALPREPDLYVVNKVDDALPPGPDAGRSREHPLSISAAKGINLDALQATIIDQLGLGAIAKEPWAFSEPLRRLCEAGEPLPAGYLG